jgi:hypothetical protein
MSVAIPLSTSLLTPSCGSSRQVGRVETGKLRLDDEEVAVSRLQHFRDRIILFERACYQLIRF